MVGQPLTIPPPSDDDHEDVAWALRAASAQWRREDRQDAVAWVRRAAETAIEVGQAIRARELFILAQRLEHGPTFGTSLTSAPPSLPPPAARLAVAPPMRAPAIPAVPLSVDDAELEFDEPDGLDDEEILFEEEVETVAELPTEAPPPSARSGVLLPSAFPSSLPARAQSPSATPTSVRDLGGGRLPSYPASVPPNPWARPGSSRPARPSSSRPPPSSQVPSLPPLPSVPAPRPGSGPPSSGSRGFDTAFLDSLDDEGPFAGRDSDPDFGEEPPTHHLGQGTRNTAVDLPLRAMRATSSLPIDQATAAEYAQRNRGSPLETHEDIEQELGVDLSVGATRPPARAPEPERRTAQRDLSPTPGRASVRPSTSPSRASPARTSSARSEPFALAPSASLPPVRIEPFVRPSFAPPPESMSEPEPHLSRRPEPELDLTGQVGRRQSSVPPPILPPADDDDDILAGAFERIVSRPPPAVAQTASPPASMAPGPASSGKASSIPASSKRGSFSSAPLPPATPAHQLDGIELLEVRGLQDLPEDAMSELVHRARVVALAPGEEVTSFGVALVSAGSVLLMPTVADASCARARQGEVVFTRGTVQSSVALRVVSAEPGTRVAVLSDADLDAVTSSCPWVRAELAEVGDRYNAFGGAVLGPLGESLDEMFRTMVLDKCVVKNPPPGTLIAHRGKPMDGMYVLGGGSLLVLGEDGRVESELAPGDIVFPETVLSASPARADIRVAKAGALLLYAGRMASHELLATCPPFIEILAG